MALSIGALILLLGLLFLIYYGFSVAMRRRVGSGNQNLMKCSLCSQEFDRSNLVDRLVGDSKLYYFCEACIESLSREIRRDR